MEWPTQESRQKRRAGHWCSSEARDAAGARTLIGDANAGILPDALYLDARWGPPLTNLSGVLRLSRCEGKR